MVDVQIKEPQLAYAPDFEYCQVMAHPFVKWAGGKRKLLPTLVDYFPPTHEIRNYFEPFLGGGAVFFHLQHPRSFLSDSNPMLIELYQVVRNDVETLINTLRKHRNEKKYYYQVRAQNPHTLSELERAARFIFLNKTCYNGLYRVNRNGHFNVPFGSYKDPLICDDEGLRAASLALQNASLSADDFEHALSIAGAEDFVYCDPPYHPLNKTSSFTAYTAGKFDSEEQARLAQVYEDLTRRNCRVMLSNSDTPLIRSLYKDFRMIEVQTHRAINRNADGRGKITELVIINY